MVSRKHHPITAGKHINASFLPCPLQRGQHAMRSATVPSGEDCEVLQAKAQSALWSTAALLAARWCPNAPLSHRGMLQLEWPGVLEEIKTTITLIHIDRHFQVKGADMKPQLCWCIIATGLQMLMQ